ncbi:MAG: M48 family metallopeptidase [Candidatus Micrarchaeota archaeon]
MALEKVNFFDEINRNKRNSLLLLIFMFLIFLALIAVFTFALRLGVCGLAFGFIVLVLYAIMAHASGDKIVLSLSKAILADEKKYAALHNHVEGIAIAAQVPKPKVYIIQDRAPNAFATGRDPEHASIAVTTGLLEICNRQEVEGVIAHEMSHVANFDIRFMMYSVVFAGAIVLLADIMLRSSLRSGSRKGGGGLLIIAIFFAVLAPIFSELIRLAISRQREYLADANGARLTRYPEGLASALKKIAKHGSVVKSATDATAPLYFAKPTKQGMIHLFSTHPPVEDRVKRLRAM